MCILRAAGESICSQLQSHVGPIEQAIRISCYLDVVSGFQKQGMAIHMDTDLKKFLVCNMDTPCIYDL